MARLRLLLVLLILTITVTGCELIKTEKDDRLMSTLTELQQQIESNEWDKALLKIRDFHNQYEDRKWKLQLLGEKEDYNEIELQIITLEETIKEKDEFQANISLGQIKHRLQSIYRF